MSLASLRSYEYQRAIDLDGKLKKLVAQVIENPVGNGSRQVREQLALELSILAEMLDPLAEETTIHAREALRLPVPMLRGLRRVDFHGQSVRNALATTIERLRGDGGELAAEDFELMAMVAAAASTEASHAFDRVVRR